MSARRIAVLAVLAVLAVSCGQQDAPRSSGNHSGEHLAGVIPFGTFLAGVRAAGYRDYARRPGTQVQSRQAFTQMRDYLLARYQHVRVVRSYAVADAVFDCTSQPGTPVPPAPASSPAGTSAAATPPAHPGACPEGSIPVQRITLASLVRFPTLDQYLSKSPGGTGGLPPVGQAG